MKGYVVTVSAAAVVASSLALAAPQVGVLLAWLVAFAIGARLLARRWEQV